jgi:hypothetical protein
LLVGRVVYKEPIPIERAEKAQMKRYLGYSYFIATIHKTDNVGLGLVVKKIDGKIRISRVTFIFNL